MSKQGRSYERVVALVMQAFDPCATVSQGKWIIGPDGRRELDVLIEGTAGGIPVKGLVECKDFNPRTTGPVGIAYLDALDSKRHDLNATFALLCSNAGFTADAIRKARRVGICLLGVMRKGDPRLRFSVIDEVYTRKVRVETMSMTLTGHTPIQLSNIPFYDILWEGVPVANWIRHRIMLLVGANPIVSGTFKATHELLQPLMFSWPNGSATATNLSFSFTVTGGWFAHRVEIDSTTGIYDWLRRRVRLTPAGGQLELRGINLDAGIPVDRPPDREFLQERFLQGEAEMKIIMFESFEYPAPVPELDQYVNAKDLDLQINELTPEVITSAPFKNYPNV